MRMFKVWTYLCEASSFALKLSSYVLISCWKVEDTADMPVKRAEVGSMTRFGMKLKLLISLSDHRKSWYTQEHKGQLSETLLLLSITNVPLTGPGPVKKKSKHENIDKLKATRQLSKRQMKTLDSQSKKATLRYKGCEWHQDTARITCCCCDPAEKKINKPPINLHMDWITSLVCSCCAYGWPKQNNVCFNWSNYSAY